LKISTKIFIGLICGVIIGAFFHLWGESTERQWLLKNIIDPCGQVFLRSLFLIIIPLIFSSLTSGIGHLESLGHVRKLGANLIGFYVLTTLAAICLGQALVFSFEPGMGFSLPFLDQMKDTFHTKLSTLTDSSAQVSSALWPGILYQIVPKNIFQAFVSNNMLAVIFISILFGLALLKVDQKKSKPAIIFLNAISDASIHIVGWIMKLAPYAVACLMISSVSQFGLGIMQKVLSYVFVVTLGCLLHFAGVYALIIKFIIKIPVTQFYKRALPAIITAFSTSSSSATLPTTIHTLETRFGVPKSITNFSLPLGATVNMDGTALFEVITAIFVAQVFGVEISFAGHIALVILILLGSIGVAGVPGGSIPVVISAMVSLGIPAEGIALVIGVDRILDMFRTTVNVTGDMTATLFLAKKENELDLKRCPL